MDRQLAIVKPVFANICMHKRMDRFTLRSKLKVDVQWTRTRFALEHKIGKIHTFGVLIQARPAPLSPIQSEYPALDQLSTSALSENMVFDSFVGRIKKGLRNCCSE